MSTALTVLGWFCGFWAFWYLVSLVFVIGGYGLARLVAPLRPKTHAQALAFHEVKPHAGAILLGLLVEAAYQLTTVTSDIVRALTGARRVAALPEGTPVLLCPGYMESSGCMVYLGAWLRRRGYRVVLIEYPSTFAPIADNAHHLHRRIQAVRKETGAQRVAIVGHSMGGVIARCLIHSFPEDHGVELLVCIASPHQGVTRRAYAPGHSARDMTYGSRHTQHFPVSRRGDVPIHTVVGVLDQIVNPPWVTMTEEGETHVLRTPIGHMGPLFISEARERILQWLQEGGVRRGEGYSTSQE